MKILETYKNTPTLVLFLLSAIILLASDRVMGSIPYTVWTLALIVILPKLASFLYGDGLDNPPPQIFGLHSPGVWAQISQTIRTAKASFDGVDVSLDWDNHQPQPGKPMYLQATITVYEPELAWMKDYLAEDQKNLRSKIVMDAWIEDLDDKSRLTLKFTTKYILFRLKHNLVISTMTNRIHNLILENIPK